jgi:hypothetical protein
MVPRAAIAGMVFIVSCASSPPQKAPAERHEIAPVKPAITKCPSAIDLGDVLARHGKAYGSAVAIAAALPWTRTLDVEIKSGGRCVEAIDATRAKTQCSFGPLVVAEGIDESGPWLLSHTGVLVRLTEDEAAEVRYDAWLARRGYLDAKSDAVSCSDGGGRAIVVVRLGDHGLGDPSLAFDLESAALLRATVTRPDGAWAQTTFDDWSPPDSAGVRWPARTTTRYAVQEPRVAHTGEPKRGGDFAPPEMKMSIAWPKSGHARIKFDSSHDEIMIRAKIGAREVWALLDSGAGISAIDGTGPAAKDFEAAFELSGSSATSKIAFGFGELTEIAIGDLKLHHVPAARVPIPVFADFGDKRPELVIGFSLFEAAAIRIDYAKKEVVIAQEAGALKSPASKSIPLRDLDGKAIAAADVNKSAAMMSIDTGNSGAFDLYEKWSTAHSLPGSLKSVEQKGRFSAGNEETVRKLFRLPSAKLGPIELKSALAGIDAPPDPGAIAGLIGNRALGRCKAIVFDMMHRSLWLDGPCDRSFKEPLAGWRLVRRDDAAYKDRPWVITGIIAGGSAERAGVQDGDRLIELAGFPATLDNERLFELVENPPGTKLQVLVARGSEKLTLPMTLLDPLAP